jgi:CheY-like chemotaxis protein
MKKIDIACIIDDDPIFIFGTKRLMQLAGYCNDFLVYNNGEDALIGLKAMIETGQKVPDIILLDINMPVMDGWEFLDEFTQLPALQKITIYMVTSSIDPEDLKKAKEYEGLTNYFVKPMNADNIKQIIEE